MRAKPKIMRVLRAPSYRQMGVIFFPTVTECGFGEPRAHPISEMPLLYPIASVGQSISIPAANVMLNSFIVTKAAPVTLHRISSPTCTGGPDSVSSSLGGIMHCSMLSQLSPMWSQAFRLSQEELGCH